MKAISQLRLWWEGDHLRSNSECSQSAGHKAIRDYTRPLKLYPTDVWALHNRALAWRGLGRIENAEEDSKHENEFDPGFRATLSGL